MGPRLTVLLAAIALAVLGATGVSAQDTATEASSVEVRVAARRLADGRTEFAAQQRQADGEWAERQLPRRRFFPASTRVGHWLASSPLTVSAPDGGGEAEIRVAAQLLADGRMEFALQERGPDGEWGERQLPRRRFFPANARVGHWLASTPLTVSLPEPEGSGSVASDRAALVAFYEATGRPAWLVNWLSDSPLGEWHGVTTNSAGRVTELTLHPDPRTTLIIIGGSGEGPGDRPLAGPLPPELGDLTSLETLSLTRNHFSGPIPPELGNLTNLKYLDLESSDHAGRRYRDYTGCVPAGLPSTGRTGLPFCNLEEDRAALVAIYEAAGGANWGNSTNWLSDMPLGEWHGVTTHLGYVVGLSLARNELSGPIPAEVGNLTSLESLELANSGFSGPIPPELGNLPDLRSLSLARNQLSGSIPAALGNLPNLISLSLGGNELSGPIPGELGNLPNLQSLNLADNELSGPVPPELGALTNLISLNFRDNQLTGPIPPELGLFPNVLSLELAENGLSGPIPSELGGLTSLQSLSLWRNELSGPIPPELGNLTNLRWLDLHDNGLSGPVPPELGNLTKLNHLNLDDNQLTGCIPAGLPGRGEPPSCDSEEDRAALVALYEATGGANWGTSTNWLSDRPIGEWYGVTASRGYVNLLWLARNELTGAIPPELGNLTSMIQLRLNGNELSGPIPPELGNLPKLQLLYVSDNELSGCVPDVLRGVARNDFDLPFCDEPGTPRALQLPVLVALYNATDGANWRFSTNWLTDRPLGEWHGIGTDSDGYVTHLYLQEKQLSGQIPAELSSLTKLQLLYLSGNELSGPIPAWLGSLTNLEQIWLHGNELSGPIPAELGSLTNLEILYLQNNELSGRLPAEFGTLTNLRGLDLRSNQLEGCVPNALRGMLHGGPGLPFCE